MMVFPMAVWKRAVPWWSLPLNWFVGMSSQAAIVNAILTFLFVLLVTFGNLVGSLFFASVIVQRE
jgi:hypothetical protein